jgi:signal transduction histidine kinase
MLPRIDSGTLFVASAVIFGGLFLSVVLAWRELRTMKGPERFAASYALFFAGLGLLVLRDRLPDLLAITVANVLIVFGAALVLEGTRLILGLPPRRRATLWSVVLSAGAFAYYTFGRPDADARTVVSSVFVGALLGSAGWIAWHRRPRAGAQVLEKVTAVALSICAGLFWARAVAVGSGLVRGAVLDESAWMAVPPLLCTLCAVVWTTTLLATTSRRLTAVVHSQNDLLASLLEVARAAGSEEKLGATLGRILEAVRAVTGATGGSLLLLDERGGFTYGMFTDGPEILVLGRADAEKLLADGLAGWVVRNRRAAIVPDVSKDPRWFRFPGRDEIVRSALSAPISAGKEASGVLTLVHTLPAHFGEDERQLIESTAAQIALALRAAQIADDRLRGRRAQALLNEVLEISARSADADGIARESAGAIARSGFWPRVYVAIPGDDGHFRLHGAPDGLTDDRPRIDEGPLGRALLEGTVQRDVVPQREAGFPHAGDGPGRRLVVPLRHLGRTLGLATFDSAETRPDDPEDAALAEALAEAIGLGLGKAALAKAREELTRMMVHDLRGPVTGVMGALELLAEARGLDADSRRLLEAAERNVRRQLNLIEGILEIARLEEGALPVTREDVPLARVVEEVVGRTLPAAAARDLTLATDIPPDLPLVRVDPGLVARVLENLLGNAVKFSARGAGPIHVSALGDGAMVEVRVRDSGAGVEDALRTRLFDKFAVGSQPGRGSGLGLPFCRLAIEAQGGRIWLEHAGPGAVFAFSLPVAARSLSANPAPP